MRGCDPIKLYTREKTIAQIRRSEWPSLLKQLNCWTEENVEQRQ